MTEPCLVCGSPVDMNGTPKHLALCNDKDFKDPDSCMRKWGERDGGRVLTMEEYAAERAKKRRPHSNN